MFLNIQDFNLVLMSNCTGRLNDAAGFNSRLIKLVEFFFQRTRVILCLSTFITYE